MITSEGLVNVDFADVKKVMSEMGRAMMGTGIADGENRAENAAKEAVASPLLEDVDLSGAKGILVNISSGYDIELAEVNTIMEYVTSFADPDAAIIFGSAFYPEMEGKIRVTLVATGIGQPDETLLMPVKAPVQQIQQSGYIQQQQVMQQSSTFMNSGYPQSNQFAQQPQQVAVQQRPQQVDNSQLFSPQNIPGFMRNNG